MRLRLNPILLSISFKVIMPRNIVPSFNLFYLLMEFFIRLCVRILHNKCGVLECKRRHLIETSRTLLAHMHVPLLFWDAALLASCYLINRKPSIVLNERIPYTLLFPHETLYPLPIRIFGSIYYVHLLSQEGANYHLDLLNISFWDILNLKKGIIVFLPISIDIFFLLMLLSLNLVLSLLLRLFLLPHLLMRLFMFPLFLLCFLLSLILVLSPFLLVLS